MEIEQFIYSAGELECVADKDCAVVCKFRCPLSVRQAVAH